MNVISKMDFTENVAIVSFEKAPAKIAFLSKLFDMVADAGINVDMISQTAPKGEQNTIAFTVSDDMVTKVLTVVTALSPESGAVMPLISAGNVKISLYGEEMPSKVGVAADAFHRLGEQGIDILLITTSNVDISIVVRSADADAAYALLQSAYLG